MSGAHDMPILLAQGTSVALFHPQRHAAVVEGMVALAPHHCKIAITVPDKIRLSLRADRGPGGLCGQMGQI